MTVHPGKTGIRVLIVDDDPLIVQLHRSYIGRIDGFEVVAEARNARQAVAQLLDPKLDIDLLILDITMPNGSGFDVLKHIRARGLNTHTIVISSVRETSSVRQALSLGVIHYLIKPFTFATFRERMAQFRQFLEREAQAEGQTTQQDIDSLFAAQRPAQATRLAKGLSPETLKLVSGILRAGTACSAAEIADAAGISRVTARRYLEHLTTLGDVERVPRHGSQGRPQSEYRWLSNTDSS